MMSDLFQLGFKASVLICSDFLIQQFAGNRSICMS